MTSIEQELEAFIDGLGLRYFKGAELTWLWYRSRKGVHNFCPPRALWQNCVDVLLVADELRARHGASIKITSAYRSPAYNAAVGGEPMSYHKIFMALDLVSPRGARQLWRDATNLRGVRINRPGSKSWFKFAGGIGRYPGFVHIDTRGKDANW